MKITFISHHFEDFGIRTIAACLKQKGHEIRRIVIHAEHRKPLGPQALKHIEKLCADSDMVGYSVLTMYAPKATQVTKFLKEKFKFPVVWGGIHSTVRPDLCIQHADAVFLGEAENSMVEFVEAYKAQGELPRDIQGVWTKKGDQVFRNSCPKLPENLMELPFPHYDFDNEFYIKGEELFPITRELYQATVKRYMTFPTRGCPYKCAYCVNNALNRLYPGGKRFRKRRIDHIIKELLYAKNNLPPIEHICLGDDAFMAMPESEIVDFAKKYKSLIGIQLDVTGGAPSTITPKKLEVLIDAGMISIRMGIQTGSPRTQKLYQRTHSNKQVLRTARIIERYAKKIKEPPCYDIILDNPWEDDQDLTDTLLLLSQLKPKFKIGIYSLTFYPGTDLYEKAKAEGLVSDDTFYDEHFYYCKDTYMNQLILKLRDRALEGKRIPYPIMKFLTNQHCREKGWSQRLLQYLYS